MQMLAHTSVLPIFYRHFLAIAGAVKRRAGTAAKPTALLNSDGWSGKGLAAPSRLYF